MQARNQTQQIQHHKVERNEDTTLLKESLLNERDDNDELRVVVKELTKQLQKLKEVNEGLIVRIKEVETAYRNLRGDL
jgi:chromosome segregation ATPase